MGWLTLDPGPGPFTLEPRRSGVREGQESASQVRAGVAVRASRRRVLLHSRLATLPVLSDPRCGEKD